MARYEYKMQSLQRNALYLGWIFSTEHKEVVDYYLFRWKGTDIEVIFTVDYVLVIGVTSEFNIRELYNTCKLWMRNEMEAEEDA